MDDLDRNLVELRRAVIDGAIQAEVRRWRRERPSASRRARAQGSASPVGAAPGMPAIASVSTTPAARSASTTPAAAGTVGPTAPSVGRKRAAWRRVRGPVIAVIVGALTLLLML